MIPTSIDGTDITGATIDGTDVTEITVDGVPVFTAFPPAAFAGSNDNNVYALDKSDGSQLWSFATGDDVDSGIAVDDTAVYAGSDDNNVYGIDKSDGSQIWSFTTGDNVRSGIGLSQ